VDDVAIVRRLQGAADLLEDRDGALGGEGAPALAVQGWWQVLPTRNSITV
jgi:hypothetical protein